MHIDDLPLVVTPHPLNDLTPDEVRELAVAAYPLIVQQLTGQSVNGQDARVDFLRPDKRNP